jgi:hypothetical protein
MVSDILRRATLLVGLLCSATSLQLLLVSEVFADPSPAERETARGLMQAGDQLRASGDIRGALARYQSAHAIMHVPTTGLEVARAQAQLGLLVEARATASEVVNLPVTSPPEPTVFVQARDAASQLSVELEPRVPSLSTTVTPAGIPYTLTIDNVKLPTDARLVAYKVDPGVHTVIVAAPGYSSQTRQVTLTERHDESITFELIAQPVAAGSGGGEPSPASAAATLESPDFGAPPQTDDPAGPGRVRGVIGLGVGGAALIAGGICGVISLVKTSSEKDKCEAGHCDRDGLSSANTLANVANIAIPVGVLGVAYGLFELLTLPSKHEHEPEARASFHFDITGLGANVKAEL